MKDNSTAQLLPCPFCGSENIGAFENMGQRTIHGQCLNCGMEGPGAKVGESPVDKWNARASVSQDAAQLVALKSVKALLGEIARIADDYDLRARIDEHDDAIADSFIWATCIEEAGRIAALARVQPSTGVDTVEPVAGA